MTSDCTLSCILTLLRGAVQAMNEKQTNTKVGAGLDRPADYATRDLTAFGEELLARYRRLQDAAAELAVDDLAALERRAVPDPGPKV